MRTIKYRGKTKDGEWVYGYYLPSIYEDVDIITVLEFFNLNQKNYHVLKETVGQFTGLLDKNGKEIYEGDIVKIKSQICGDLFFEVVYSIDEAAFAMKMNGNAVYRYFEEIAEGRMTEVIGNIHDNSEQLIKD